MDPDCLHCRIGEVLKKYLEEARDSGADDDRRIDNVLTDMAHVITDVLAMSPVPGQRVELAMMVVKDILRSVQTEMEDHVDEMKAARGAGKVRH